MRVKVERYVNSSGDIKYGIFVRRWWFPCWVKVDWWDNEEVAIKKAIEIKHPKITEIT